MVNFTITKNFSIENEIKNILLSHGETNIYNDSNSIIPAWTSILLLIVGFIGNFLSFIIFLRMKKNSIFSYLTALSFIDLFVLAVGQSDFIFITYFGYYLRNVSLLMCRLTIFIIYSSTELSNFFLVSALIDRTIATCCSSLSKRFNNLKTAKRIILFDCLLVFLINFHILLFLGYNDSQYVFQNFFCGYNSTYYTFFDSYFFWIDLFFYWMIPLVLIFICGCMISSKLHKISRNLDGIKNEKNDVDDSLLNDGSIPNKKITLTVLLLSFLFIFLVSPYVIIRILRSFGESEDSIENLRYYRLSNLIAYINHSIRFIIYYCLLPNFKESCLKLFCIKSKNSNQNFDNNHASL